MLKFHHYLCNHKIRHLYNIQVIFAWVKRSESFRSKSNVETGFGKKKSLRLKFVKVAIRHPPAQTPMSDQGVGIGISIKKSSIDKTSGASKNK